MGGKGSTPPPPPPPAEKPPPAAKKPSYPSFEPPEFTVPEGPSPEELQEQADQVTYDELTAARAQVVEDAISQTGAVIDEERAAAAVRGVDYNITEEEIALRTNNTFATLWSAVDAGKLSAIVTKYGWDFDDLGVTRGTPDEDKDKDGKKPPSEASTSGGKKKGPGPSSTESTLLTDKLAQKTLLGGS